jgi:peptidoglycan/xylan/chitin deacetylase (PgdA/CDA1 family)
VADGVDTGQAKKPGHWTQADLKLLDGYGVHWDFFINSNNACSDITAAGADPVCIAAIKDILALHHPGNHTVHHAHLGNNPMNGDPFCTNEGCVDTELSGVESAINTISGGATPHLTRFRAPFGEPFQAMGPGLSFAQTEVAKYAVQVGWNLDSDDSNHDDGVNCIGTCWTGQDVLNHVVGLIGTPGTGSTYGILLMHGIFGWTHDAIPLLFDPTTGYLAKNKFRVGTIEDAICWKYGKHSWEIVQQNNPGQTRGPN